MAPQDNKEITLIVTIPDVQNIVEALGVLPFNKVNDLLNKVINQTNAQLAPPAPAENLGPLTPSDYVVEQV